MGVVQDRTRKSKNDSRTLVGNKLYECERDNLHSGDGNLKAEQCH